MVTVEHAYGLGRRLLDGVCNAQESGRPPVNANKHHGLTFPAECLSPLGQWAWIDADLFEQLLVAECHGSTLHMSHHALPRHRPKLLDGCQPEAFLLSGRHDGTGQRVLASLLEARRQPQHLAILVTCHSLDR